MCVVFSSSSKVTKVNFKDGVHVYSRIKNKKYAQLNLHLLDILWKNSCDCDMQSCACELHTSPAILWNNSCDCDMQSCACELHTSPTILRVICKESTTLKEIQQPNKALSPKSIDEC